MAGVDLNTYKFDFDLTFAVLLMNGDGTTYHRYGSRDHSSATSRLSMKSLVRLLRETLEDHRAYQKSPSPPQPLPRRIIEEIPPMARKLKKEKIECFHCHMVNEADRDFEEDTKSYSREKVIGMWPLPDKVGIRLDPEDLDLVQTVLPGSPAAAAGLQPMDRIVRVGGERVRTEADFQWVLERWSPDETALPVEYRRAGGPPTRAELRLPKGWKAADALGLSWRASMWQLRPRLGFGGGRLKKEELEKLGLDPQAFAIKVGYIVDWGDSAYTGQSVKRAGLRKGDIVLSVDGKKDFESERHFQSWFRHTRKPGDKVELEALRDGKPIKIELPVLE